MTKQKKLSVVSEQSQRLGRPTVMDRALAQKHGAAYVHLAAFAIDIDRVRELDPEDGTLPFGWEVALTDAYVTRVLAARQKDGVASLLEDAVLSVLELPRPTQHEAGPLGTQLPFAVYTATERGELPETLSGCFRVWKKPPHGLARDVSKLIDDEPTMREVIAFCLAADISPPLVEPVRASLDALRQTFED